jgi:hypothetical protein
MCMEVLVPHFTNIKRIKQMFEPHLFFIILLWGLSWWTCYFFALLLPLVHSPITPSHVHSSITPCCFALLYLIILFWCITLFLCLLVVVKPWNIFLGLFKKQIKSWNGKFEVYFSKFDKFFMFHFMFFLKGSLLVKFFILCVCIYIYFHHIHYTFAFTSWCIKSSNFVNDCQGF